MSEPIRVLVADDAEEVRFVLCRGLELDGRFHVVGEARNGVEAVDLAGSERPDAVVLDLAMPVMDGLQAAPEIRRRSPASRIIVLSGFDGEWIDEGCRRSADRLLKKGAPLGELVQALVDLCGGGCAIAARDAPAARAQEQISIVTHELRTPLTAIRGYATLLGAAMERLDPTQVVDLGRRLGRIADDMNALIGALEDAHAIEQGVDLDRQPTCVAGLVREVVRDMSPVTVPHPVIVEIDEGVGASIDRMRVRQILVNLISNAAKFSPERAPIEIRARADGADVEIRVVDHGPGVPAGREAELFGKFSRLGQSAKGIGLGLYISRGLARAHGGDLVHERPEGGGSCFRLRLPAS